MKYAATAWLLALTFAPLSAAAQGAGPISGFYGKAEVGASFSRDADIRDDDPNSANCLIGGPLPSGCGGKLDDIGDSPLFGFGLGYRFTPLLRADVAVTHRSSFELDDDDQGIGGLQTAFDGDLASTTLMLNGYIDLPFAAFGIAPWFGAGIGYARNRLSHVAASAFGVSSNLPGDTEDGIAYQLMAGAGFALAPGVMLDLGYRYLDAGEVRIEPGTDFVPGGTPPQVFFDGATGDLRAHEITLGLRLWF